VFFRWERRSSYSIRRRIMERCGAAALHTLRTRACEAVYAPRADTQLTSPIPVCSFNR
jgi:hypothetical protein